MSDFIKIPKKLIRPTKKGDSILITAVRGNKDKAEFLSCCLSPREAREIAETILTAYALVCPNGEEVIS